MSLRKKASALLFSSPWPGLTVYSGNRITVIDGGLAASNGKLTVNERHHVSNNAFVSHFLLSLSVGPSKSCTFCRMSLAFVLDHSEK